LFFIARFGYIPFILSPFGIVAVLTFAVLVYRCFDQAPCELIVNPKKSWTNKV